MNAPKTRMSSVGRDSLGCVPNTLASVDGRCPDARLYGTIAGSPMSRRSGRSEAQTGTEGCAAAHQLRSALPEDRLEQKRRRRLELVVAARHRRLVRSPALVRRPVSEAGALEVVVSDLRDSLRPERLPRQVLATVPT